MLFKINNNLSYSTAAYETPANKGMLSPYKILLSVSNDFFRKWNQAMAERLEAKIEHRRAEKRNDEEIQLAEIFKKRIELAQLRLRDNDPRH